MNKLIIILLLLGLTVSCKKEEKAPCDNLVNGVYQFPELPENHNMTSQEVTEFWDLPEDICNCITTEGLIETVMDYPDLRLIMAGSSPQSGYDLLIRERFRGIRELETRPDRAIYLLKKYKMIDPIGYDSNWDGIDIAGYIINNIWYYQIILSQYSNLEVFTNQEKIELIETAFVVYNKSKADTVNNNDVLSLATTSVVTARLMKLDKYQPFMNVYNENNAVFEVVEYYWPTTYETVELIYSFSERYLKFLKNK